MAQATQSQPDMLSPPNPVSTQTVYVDRNQFCKLLISRKQLIRSDDQLQQMRGLMDVTTGVLYLTRECEL